MWISGLGAVLVLASALGVDVRLKPGVKIMGVQPETVYAMSVTAELLREHDIGFVITSIMDGVHARGSRHYLGYAFDFRTRDMAHGQPIQIKTLLQENLGADYDVILEDTHIHVEMDVKR